MKKCCKNCEHYIEIFGAHRGGVYCQVGYRPTIVTNINHSCSRFIPRSEGPHKMKFEAVSYPNLLSKQDSE